MRVSGDSMEGAGISDGDELIVNRALEPRDGSVVVAVLDGELTIKTAADHRTPGSCCRQRTRRTRTSGCPSLSDLVIWGVATRCLHHV